MFTVNNAVPAVVGYYPLYTGVSQISPMADTHAGSNSELNTKLLSELIAKLGTPYMADKFDDIRATLNQYGLNTSGENFKLAALERTKTANDGVQPSDDVAGILANQEQQAKSTAQLLADIQREIATNRTKVNYAFSQFSAQKQKAVSGAAAKPEIGDDEISTHTSYAELWARMAAAIKEIKGDYVDFYAELMQKYTKMYEAYNTVVQGAASKAVSAGDDGNNVKFNEDIMAQGYSGFWPAIAPIDLGRVKNWEKMTDEERKAMVTTLAPAFKVSDGVIKFNLDQYSAAPNYPAGIKDGKVSTASYQAWLANFNAAGSALQSNMQAFAQRYSQANSTFDNLNKVLSGSIASLAESAKDVLKALG